MTENKHYDDLEIRDPQQREEQQLTELSAQLAHAKANSEYYAEVLADIDPASINNRAALSQLPTTRKSDLAAQQKKSRPLGGLNAVPTHQLKHIFSSPGGVYEPDDYGADYWPPHPGQIHPAK